MFWPRHVLLRHWRLVLLVLVVVVIFAIFYVLRSILFPFLFGLLLAYMLLPLVAWLERRLPQWGRRLKFNRVLAIIIIYWGSGTTAENRDRDQNLSNPTRSTSISGSSKLAMTIVSTIESA